MGAAGAAPPSQSGPIVLPSSDVHLWHVRLGGVSAPRLQELRATLSEPELDRMARYRFPYLRNRYVVCRGILRQLLGRYLNTPPVAIPLSQANHGKPTLGPALRGSGLRFNLSHSKSTAVIALSRDREVGVDVEHVRPLDSQRLAERVLSPGELSRFSNTPLDSRHEEFFYHWTRKEAFAKALSVGLGLPLASYDAGGGETPAIPCLKTVRGPQGRAWSVMSFETVPGAFGGLAVEGLGWRLCEARLGGGWSEPRPMTAHTQV